MFQLLQNLLKNKDSWECSTGNQQPMLQILPQETNGPLCYKKLSKL